MSAPQQQPVAVYQPFQHGLPSLKGYFASLWRRRDFIFEYARADLHQKQYGTVLGQLWLIVTPLLLAGIYYLLLIIIGVKGGATRFGHLTGTLFLFYLVTNSITSGAKSVTSGSRLVLNSAFPRLVLPIAETLIALMRFLPTLVVLMAIHIALGLPFTIHILWAPVILFLVTGFALSCAIMAATVNVYFRDAQNLLPYLSRTLLYLSPVLYTSEMLDQRLHFLTLINPLFPFLDSWSAIMIEGRAPLTSDLLLGLGWTLALLSIGSYFFLTREREFAVRI